MLLDQPNDLAHLHETTLSHGDETRAHCCTDLVAVSVTLFWGVVFVSVGITSYGTPTPIAGTAYAARAPRQGRSHNVA